TLNIDRYTLSLHDALPILSDIDSLVYIQEKTGIKIGELLFAGILIAALGAVMDVAMSIASTIQEIHDKNPALTRKELSRSGIHRSEEHTSELQSRFDLVCR